jgi:hypothetical protein
VSLLIEQPQWPPLVVQGSRDDGSELPPLAPAEGVYRPFVFDREKNWYMWFRVRGVLINEGAGTARVRLEGTAKFVRGTSELAAHAGNEIYVPRQVNAPIRREYLMRPNDFAMFEWECGHSLEDWADAYQNPDPPNPRGSCRLVVTAYDFIESGIVDLTPIEMTARPLQPVSGAQGQWRIFETFEEASIGATVYPTIRTYRAEGWETPAMPWDPKE